jgi:hypothetical protein
MTGVDYSTGTPAFEQRIGGRVAIYGLDVTWVEPLREAGGGRKPAREWPGQIEEVSVTGASIRGPAAMSIGLDCRATLRFRGEDTVVSINRRQRTESPGVLRYGVEWIDLQPELKAQVYEAVAPDNESPERWDLNA